MAASAATHRLLWLCWIQWLCYRFFSEAVLSAVVAALAITAVMLQITIMPMMNME